MVLFFEHLRIWVSQLIHNYDSFLYHSIVLTYLCLKKLILSIFRKKKTGISELTNFDDIPLIEKPIGIIPAGSTDTVAYCLNGTCDVRTTVLNIVLGQVNGLDLSSVSSQNGLLKFYASVMSYGFLGDVAIESEKFRWMGPKRYDYSGKFNPLTPSFYHRKYHLNFCFFF